VASLKESKVSRDNYSYKKYQKELARKKKVEEKKQRKLEKKAMEATPESGQHLALKDGQVRPSGQVPNDQVALE
jgi:hypothetical protein